MERSPASFSTLWTPELSVGSVLLDQHNQAVLARCATVDSVLLTHQGQALSIWMHGLLDQFDTLLSEEEGELAAIDYPELSYHCVLHARARNLITAARLRFATAEPNNLAATAAARSACTSLSVWLMRHILDADRLFLPYIDARFRQS